MSTNSKASPRKNSIELFRIYAAVCIVILHMMARDLLPKAEGFSDRITYLVDFFFLISGFLMMRHLDHAKKAESSIEYVLYKAKGLFAPVCMANAGAFIVFCITNNVKSAASVFDELWHFRWEFIMMQCAGMIQDPQFNTDYLNGPAWYISALLIATFFTYGLAVHCRKFYVNLFAPLFSLAVYTYISQTFGIVNVGNQFVGPIQVSVLRGAAGICVGSLCYEIYKKLNADNRQVTKTMKYLDLIGWLSIPFWFVTFIFTEDSNSIFFILLGAIALIFGFLDKTPVSHFLNNLLPSIIGWLGEFSLYIYLCHFTVIMLVAKFMEDASHTPKAAVTISVTIIYSLLVYAINKKRKTAMPVCIICAAAVIASFVYGVI